MILIKNLSDTQSRIQPGSGCDRCNLLIGHIEYHNLLQDMLEYLE